MDITIILSILLGAVLCWLVYQNQRLNKVIDRLQKDLETKGNILKSLCKLIVGGKTDDLEIQVQELTEEEFNKLNRGE